MKVLLIAHSCQVGHEGQQRAQALGEMPGIDLRVVVPDRWREPGGWRAAEVPRSPSYAFQVETVRLPWTGPGQWYLHHYPNLGKIIRDFRPDIIDVWEEAWGLVSVQACWLRNRWLPSARVLSETEANIPRVHPPPFRQFRAYTLKNTDFAVARQSEGVEVLRAKGYTGRVEVVGNAVDENLFRPLDRAACRRALGVEGFVVGYVGRLVEAKGLLDIVEALPQGPADLTLLLVGSGPDHESLQRRVQALGWADRVRFLTPRPWEELPEVMNALDALLLVSRTTATWKEQFGRVIIEAQACGTPVVGSNSGAIPEVIGQGGIVVREGDPAGIAAALRRLRTEPRLGPELGRLGRRQVEERYTWRRVAEQMDAIYGEMMRTGRSAAGKNVPFPG